MQQQLGRDKAAPIPSPSFHCDYNITTDRGGYTTGYQLHYRMGWNLKVQQAENLNIDHVGNIKKRNTRIFKQKHNSNFRVQQLIQDNINLWIRAYST
jgi:hypothetical protein